MKQDEFIREYNEFYNKNYSEILDYKLFRFINHLLEKQKPREVITDWDVILKKCKDLFPYNDLDSEARADYKDIQLDRLQSELEELKGERTNLINEIVTTNENLGNRIKQLEEGMSRHIKTLQSSGSITEMIENIKSLESLLSTESGEGGEGQYEHPSYNKIFGDSF